MITFAAGLITDGINTGLNLVIGEYPTYPGKIPTFLGGFSQLQMSYQAVILFSIINLTLKGIVSGCFCNLRGDARKLQIN